MKHAYNLYSKLSIQCVGWDLLVMFDAQIHQTMALSFQRVVAQSDNIHQIQCNGAKLKKTPVFRVT